MENEKGACQKRNQSYFGPWLIIRSENSFWEEIIYRENNDSIPEKWSITVRADVAGRQEQSDVNLFRN